jgi:peptidoglycan/LPS O-acetylase OafA/YrhL
MAGNGYIKSLDGVRAIAIILVMTYHAEITHFGWTGVQLFFVLSGFLITGILWNEKTREGSLSFKLKKFWVRRSLRIFPLYFGYVIAIGISYLLFHFPSYFEMYFPYLVSYTVNFTRLLPGWEGNPLFTHLWSLSIEEQFYLLFPLIIFLCPPKLIKFLLIAVILLSPVFRFLLGEYYKNKGLAEDVVANAVNFHTLSHLDAFFMGGIIPVFSLQNRVKNSRKFFLVTLAIVMGAGIINFIFTQTGSSYWLDLGYNHWLIGNYQHVWLYTCINLFGASVILLLISPDTRWKIAAFFRKILESKWLVQIGKVSYGMYLFHWLILVYVFNNIYKPETLTTKLLMFIPYTVAVYLFSQLSYNLYEVHFIKLKDKFFTGKSKPKKEVSDVLQTVKKDSLS